LILDVTKQNADTRLVRLRDWKERKELWKI